MVDKRYWISEGDLALLFDSSLTSEAAYDIRRRVLKSNVEGVYIDRKRFLDLFLESEVPGSVIGKMLYTFFIKGDA